MDVVSQFLIDRLGVLGAVFFLGGIGLALVVASIPFVATKKKDPYDRLSGKKTQPTQTALRQDNEQRLERFSSFLEPQDIEEFSNVRLKLIQAGYRKKESVRIFYFAQFVLGLGLLALGLVYTFATKGDDPLPPTKMVLQILGPAIFGYMAPKIWVNKRQKARQEEIGQGFPDSLDMLLVCVEAGQSLEQSIIRVAAELRSGFPALAEEYEMVAHEMKAGKDKSQVLRDMAERAGNDDIASFVTVLIQSQTYGTSIADALRVYAAEMRDKRVMRAEEKANKLPTKMTLTTMMLTVPPLLIILLGPSPIDIQKAFGGG